MPPVTSRMAWTVASRSAARRPSPPRGGTERGHHAIAAGERHPGRERLPVHGGRPFHPGRERRLPKKAARALRRTTRYFPAAFMSSRTASSALRVAASSEITRA